MNTLLDNLKWRYATKKYEAGKTLSAADLDYLKQAIQYSASSMGLQPYKVIVVSNPQIREKLFAAAYNQSPIVDASHIFVFASILDLGPKDVNAFIENVSQTRQVPVETLSNFENYLNGAISQKEPLKRNEWAARQTYIALGNLLAAAAERHIDATPMEGFEPDAFDEILNLKELGLTASVIATVGYRTSDDPTQFAAKVRKSEPELFINL